jgi:shikimate dehydrogenase
MLFRVGIAMMLFSVALAAVVAVGLSGLLGGEETALIRYAREAGARTVPGDRMLLYQGVQAQRVWTGREPDVRVMSEALAG